MSLNDAHTTAETTRYITFPGTDLQVKVHLEDGDLVLEVMKQEAIVYRAVVEQATGKLEHAWMAELFTRNDHVRLGDLSAEMDDYLTSHDIAQG